jgi:hypothetical protein
MIKNMCLLPRRADFTRPRFHLYYESQHTPLALQHFRTFGKYARNHVQWAEPEVRFDTLSEFWFDALEDAIAIGRQLDSPAGEVIREDERQFMDQPRITPFGVTESLLAGEPRGEERGPMRTHVLLLGEPGNAATFADELAALGRRWADVAGLRRVMLNLSTPQPGRPAPYAAVLSGWPGAAEDEAAFARIAADAASLAPVTRLACETVETRREWLRD